MMKNKNRRKKTLTAVGAVVAAGLTPGIIAATPSCLPAQDPNVEITAAEVVAIGGMTYSFDELFAMQQPDDGMGQREPRPQPLPQHAARYGVRPTVRPSGQHLTMYGVPRPSRPTVVIPLSPYEEMRNSCLEYLMEYCAQLIDADARGILISPDSDLTRELGMNEDQLKELKAEIMDCYGVEVSHYRFYLIGQLNTLRLVAENIAKIRISWNH
jgi:hypothetical protein